MMKLTKEEESQARKHWHRYTPKIKTHQKLLTHTEKIPHDSEIK